MNSSLESKSTVEEIKERFDRDVARFTNLATGQSATIDAPLAMELITRAASAATPEIRRCLDIGCGAGNNTLSLIAHHGKDIACDLCDLSHSMLEAARERVSASTHGMGRLFHGDFRTLDFEPDAHEPNQCPIPFTDHTSIR